MKKPLELREKKLIVNSAINCQSCGATSLNQDSMGIVNCAYCGSNLINKMKESDSCFPDSFIPFIIKSEIAQKNIREWLGNIWFAPNDLKNSAQNKEAIKGCYVPYWSFGAETSTDYSGERGYYYYETKYRTVNAPNGEIKTENYQVKKIAWTHASGNFQKKFDNILIEGQKSLPNEITDDLGPWDLSKLQSFNQDGMFCYQILTPSESVENGWTLAKNSIHNSIRAEVKSLIGGNEQKIYTCNVSIYNPKYEQILLPMWIGAYIYKGKTYRVCVNGDTGKVDGQRPLSWIKIILFTLMMICLVTIIILALSQNKNFNINYFLMMVREYFGI